MTTIHNALTDFVAAHEVLEKAQTAFNAAEIALKPMLGDNRVVFGEYLVEPTPRGIRATKITCIPRGVDAPN